MDTRRDKIRNEDIRDKEGVVFVVDKMREERWGGLGMCKDMHEILTEEVWDVGHGGLKERQR